MMAFNPFNAAQLPAGLTGTPIKAEDNAEALRFLAAGGAGLLGAAPMGFPPVDAVRAMLPGGLPFPLVYPGLPPQDFKPELFTTGGGPMNPMLFEQFGFHPYGGLDGSRRKNATRETTAPLKEWLTQHRSNPYPTKGEKVMLAVMTKMTLTQVSTWFANARRRLKKENGGSMAIKRREGDDEDDMADLDRPSSSNSNGSDKEDVDVDAAEPNENVKTVRDELTPKKKILSIDDILDKTSGKKDEEAGSSKKGSPSSEESAPSLQFGWQQMLAMCRANPQLMAAMAPRPGFFPFNPLMMNMAAMPQTPTGPPLNGSFTSETASVSPSSSHSPSAPKEEPQSPQPSTEA